jgi:hypothetical protein
MTAALGDLIGDVLQPLKAAAGNHNGRASIGEYCRESPTEPGSGARH